MIAGIQIEASGRAGQRWVTETANGRRHELNADERMRSTAQLAAALRPQCITRRLLEEQPAQGSVHLLRELLTTFINALLSAETDVVCRAEDGASSPHPCQPPATSDTATSTPGRGRSGGAF